MTDKVNDAKTTFLHTEIGKPTGTASLNDAEMSWLSTKGGVGDTLEQRWVSVMIASEPLVKVGQSFNDNSVLFLQGLGYVGTLPEMWLQYWLNGGEVRPPLTLGGVTVTHNGEPVYHG